MSREIRRVPIGWQHPTEPDPYYREREARIRLAEALGHQPYRTPPSRLVKPGERFVALLSPSLSVRQREWDEGLAQWLAGTHQGFDFNLRYHHKDGFIDRDGERSFNPLHIYAEDGETVLREVVHRVRRRPQDRGRLHRGQLGPPERRRRRPVHARLRRPGGRARLVLVRDRLGGHAGHARVRHS